jgi:hypothetical protein
MGSAKGLLPVAYQRKAATSLFVVNTLENCIRGRWVGGESHSPSLNAGTTISGESCPTCLWGVIMIEVFEGLKKLFSTEELEIMDEITQDMGPEIKLATVFLIAIKEGRF